MSENSMNKSDVVSKVAEKAGMKKKDAESAVTAFLETIKEALVEGKKVPLIGFGTFEVRERAARQGRNPQTKEVMEIPAANVPSFKAGKALKEAVNPGK